MTSRRLRVLVVDDSEADARLLLRELARCGYTVTHLRVDTEETTRAALMNEAWDIVFADYAMPSFGAMRALELLRESTKDIPAIVLSGKITEDAAVELLTGGARDFMVKGQFARLGPALDRELREAATRREKRSAEASLRASEERFRTLVASMDDMVFTLDTGQHHTGTYGRWTAWDAATVSALDGRTLREVIGDAAEVHEDAAERALSGEAVVYEWSVVTATGPRHYQTSLSPMRDARGEVRGVVGVGRETTAQKRLQAQLLIADRMSSMGTLAAGVGHELNNPLAVVLANVGLVIERLAEAELAVVQASAEGEGAPRTNAPGPEEDRTSLLEELSEVRDAAVRMQTIVRDLKLFSRVDEERRVPCDVREIMETSLRMVATEVRHRARLERRFEPVPPALVDEGRLGQVFVNLLLNAVQALQEGPGNLIEVTIAPDEQGRVVVCIRDTGAGVAPELLEKVFEPFFTTKPIGIGTGLGLPICRRIVTAYGGSLRLEAAEGGGTRCVVTLPPSEAPSLGLPTPPPRLARATRRGRIALVDDDETVARAVARVLQLDHDVELPSARELLERAREGDTFDAIVSDLMMPEIDGVALYEELASIAPALADRIVFMTGGAFTSRARSLLARVKNQRVDKPIDMVRLREILRRMVR